MTRLRERMSAPVSEVPSKRIGLRSAWATRS
jgi:hypothetical protein